MKGTKARLLIDEFDFSCATAEVELSISVIENDATVLCSTAMEYDPSLATGSITVNGFFDGADTGGVADALNDRLGTSGVNATVILGFGDTDAVAYTIPNSFGSSMDISAPTTGLIAMNGTFSAGDGIKRAAAPMVLVTASATGGGTVYDNGSAGSAGGKAWLHVHEITGSATNATITVESDSSSGMGTAATEGTFTFSAVGAYELDMSGVVGQYLRANVTSLGGATSIKYSLIVNVDGIN